MLKQFLISSLVLLNILTADTNIQKKDLAIKDMKSQNKEIVKLAAAEMSKNLPQAIDQVTQLTDIRANGATMEFVHEINIGKKSDKVVINEDHSRMGQAVTKGTCVSSKRFLESDITLSYIYKSAKTKVELFRFNVSQKDCLKL